VENENSDQLETWQYQESKKRQVSQSTGAKSIPGKRGMT